MATKVTSMTAHIHARLLCERLTFDGFVAAYNVCEISNGLPASAKSTVRRYLNGYKNGVPEKFRSFVDLMVNQLPE